MGFGGGGGGWVWGGGGGVGGGGGGGGWGGGIYYHVSVIEFDNNRRFGTLFPRHVGNTYSYLCSAGGWVVLFSWLAGWLASWRGTGAECHCRECGLVDDVRRLCGEGVADALGRSTTTTSWG